MQIAIILIISIIAFTLCLTAFAQMDQLDNCVYIDRLHEGIKDCEDLEK